MRCDMEVGGRARQVLVTRAGDRFEVEIDGRILTVNAARVDAQTLSLLIGYDTAAALPGLPSNIYARELSYDVRVTPETGSARLAVRVGPTWVLVGVNARRRPQRGDEGTGAGLAPQRLIAPMPGKIVRLLVQPGDPVHVHQPLVVVEAMKMENDLRAVRDGTVAEICVQEGTTVEAGALLLVIR